MASVNLKNMKRKRLNHFADAISGMLTGYQIVANYNYFESLGEGEYSLDLLKASLTFKGNRIEMFPIFSNIQKWFQKEIKQHRIDVNFIIEAKVILLLKNRLPQNKIKIEITKWIFFKRIYEIDRYEYKTVINCILKTDEHDYSKKSVGAIWN